MPTAQWNGDLAAGLTIRAWDGSKGTLGGTSSAAVVGGSTPFSAESATVALRVRPVNDAPTITKLTATSVNASTIRPYVEGAAPIVVDTAVTLADLDLASGNGGAGQWAGATLTVERDGGSHPDDVFGASGSATSGLFLDADGVLKVNGIAVGSYVSADGRLTMSFESSATTAVVNTAARGITYFNAMTNDRSARTVRLVYSLDDGAGSADVGVDQGSGGAKTASASILLNLNRRPDAVDDVAVLANPTLKAVVRGDVTPLAGQPGADSDLDGQSLTVKGLWLGDDRAARLIGNIGVLLQGQYGTLLMYGTGSYTYTFNRAVGDAQTDVFTYLVDDGRGGQSTATLTIRLGGGG